MQIEPTIIAPCCFELDEEDQVGGRRGEGRTTQMFIVSPKTGLKGWFFQIKV